VEFAVDRTTVHGRPTLTVRGELDLGTAPELAAAVDDELAEGPSVLVVDLTPATFLDSSGARQLAKAARLAGRQDVELHVVCPRSNRPVRLPIDLLDLHAVMSVVESADDLELALPEEQVGP
jgi:anti-sigma B factor antagonist